MQAGSLHGQKIGVFSVIDRTRRHLASVLGLQCAIEK